MPTIKDVAKRAGVSITTVSFVLNNNPSVKMETRYKVLQTIEEIGYVPNQYARSLVTKHKGAIGVVRNGVEMGRGSTKEGYAFDALPNTYLADMLDVIVAEINNSGYSMLLDWVYWLDDVPVEMWTLPSIMNANRIDGLIWAGGILMPAHLERFRQLKFPIVLIGARDDDYDWVDTDPGKGIYEMTKHVISCGHKDIAFINGLGSTQTSARKMAGFSKAMQEAGLEVLSTHCEKATFSGSGGYAAMDRLLAQGIQPTAVITAHDTLAAGVIRYLSQKGIACPADISVTGFEDGLLSEYSNPPLTTVYTNKKMLGAQGSQILINRISNPKAKHVKMIVEPKIILRDSVRNL